MVSKKLAYLQHALKDSTAKYAIGGLTQLAGSYKRAIECLQKHYDHPRLIHQVHVGAIINAAPLRDEHSQELHGLHDVVISAQTTQWPDKIEYAWP